MTSAAGLDGRQGTDEMRRERLGAAAVYAVAAVLYFVAREAAGLDFIASPLFYGVSVLVASFFRPRLLASAVVLIVWGIAVVLDGKGPLAEGRTAPVHTFAFGLSALVLLLLRRRIPERVSLESLAVIMIVVGLWYYFVHDYPVLERAWLWSAVFLANAAALAAADLAGKQRATSNEQRG